VKNNVIEDRASRKNSGAPEFLWNSSAFRTALLTQTPFPSAADTAEEGQRPGE
jgi:hypothetical protein